MKAVNQKLLVRSDPEQKQSFLVGGVQMTGATMFNQNYRERSPVVCQSEQDSGDIKQGDILVCHHNTFYSPSPYHLYEDLFSIPLKGTIIFCKVNPFGGLIPLLGNMIVETIPIEDKYAHSFEERNYYPNRIQVVHGGGTDYQKGDLLFTRPLGAYEMVYHFKGEERRVFKCHENQIVGRFILKPA